jgi:hypothetical protein
MGTLKLMLIAFLLTNFCAIPELQAADLFREQSGVDSAVERYKVSGKDVVIAILDRGIEWQNPDFIGPDGKTRIKWLLDMSGQNWCDDPRNPRADEYSADEINAALAGRSILNSRDAVGHGTVTAGIAAGNGRSFGDGIHHGVAPEADLIIVKMTSDGALQHDGQPSEEAFNGCIGQALDWLNQKIEHAGKPVVALINSGVQLSGPLDGTSIVSRKIEQVFGNRPGRIFVAPSGDEAGLPTHAGGDYSNSTIVNISRSSGDQTQLDKWSQLAIWFKGPPASIAVEFDDVDHGSLTARTDVPGEQDNQNRGGEIYLHVYEPGQEPYPTTSVGIDRFVNLAFKGHASTGRITLHSLPAEVGRFDMYSDLYWDPYGNPKAVTTFADHFVSGRLTDYASTRSAIVIGAYVSTNTWTDIDGNPQSNSDDVPQQIWKGSAGGPTRDGRHLGVDVAAPGENVFASYASHSVWATPDRRWALIQDGGGHYGLQGATSGAAPIAVGAIALMLEMKPDLTSDQVRDLLRKTASHDGITVPIPDDSWGYGRINVRAALDLLCSLYHSPKCSN